MVVGVEGAVVVVAGAADAGASADFAGPALLSLESLEFFESLESEADEEPESALAAGLAEP